MVGEDKPSRDGVILYPHAKFEVYSENVGLKHRIKLKLIANRISPVMKNSIDSTSPPKKKGGPLGPPFRMGRAMGPNCLFAPLTLTGEVALLSSLGTKTTRTGTHS